MAKVEGLENLSRAIDTLKFETRVQIGRAVEESAVEMARAIKAAAPVSSMDPHPGALKNSVRVVPGRTPFFAQIVADAKDAKGKEYGAHLEYGHRTRYRYKSGANHVPAQPFFWPAYRLVRKRVFGRIKRAINSAAKTAAKG